MNVNHSPDINCCFVSNEVYAPFCAVAITSLIRHSSRNRKYKIYLLTHDMREQTEAVIKNLARENINIDIETKKIPTPCKLPPYAAKFYILDALKEIDKVLYIDSDMLLMEDVSTLYDEDLGNAWMGACRDYPLSARESPRREKHIQYLNDIGIKQPEEHYFNSGLMLLNLRSLREHHISAEACLKACEKKLYTWLDQDVLNIFCYGHVKYFHFEWNVMMVVNPYFFQKSDDASMLREAYQSPKIVHFASPQKPWNFLENILGETKKIWEMWKHDWWNIARESSFYEELLVAKITKPLLLSHYRIVEHKLNETNSRLASIEKSYNKLRAQMLSQVLKRKLLWVRWRVFLHFGGSKQKYIKRKRELEEQIKKLAI